MAFPVFTGMYLSSVKRRGEASQAPARSLKWMAIPSIAAALYEGDERLAMTGSAVKRPRLSSTAISSTVLLVKKPCFSSAANHKSLASLRGLLFTYTFRLLI